MPAKKLGNVSDENIYERNDEKNQAPRLGNQTPLSFCSWMEPKEYSVIIRKIFACVEYDYVHYKRANGLECLLL